ncbi:MAG: hypothetical protein ABSD10_01835 [Candidatus Saccharimonadales bacterium]|jgi:hypothetical protein
MQLDKEKGTVTLETSEEHSTAWDVVDEMSEGVSEVGRSEVLDTFNFLDDHSQELPLKLNARLSTVVLMGLEKAVRDNQYWDREIRFTALEMLHGVGLAQDVALAPTIARNRKKLIARFRKN